MTKIKKVNRCNIGGQAVLEGVMMMGSNSLATAVRDETGTIQVESKRIKPLKEKSVFRKIPFLRGVLNFCTTMYQGVSILLRSSAVFDGESEPTKFEQWCAKKLKIDAMSILMGISVVIGLGLAIGLFFVVPHFILVGLRAWLGAGVHEVWYQLIEGVVRIAIFAAYIGLASLMKEIKRTFMYHGAEHKTISAFEYGLDLTVENVQKQTTIHDRCGTTFMFLVMVISILVFSLTALLGAEFNIWVKLLLKLALLPVVAGISYEILKFLAKFDNWFVKIIKAPGLLLQKLTTKQPTDEMVEVAIMAFNTVLAMDADPDMATSTFNTKVLYKNVRAEVDKLLVDTEGGNVDADWIVVEVLGIKRSEIDSLSHIKSLQADKILKLTKKRASGLPLQQVFGNTSFYGIEISVNANVLCPRPETEYLVEAVVNRIKESGYKTVLDLCTGSGSIAIAIATLAQDVIVTASDLSSEALEVARENAVKNSQDITFVQSDMFADVNGMYDVIVSNPPYIKTEDIAGLDTVVKNHEPIMALDGGEDGYDFYRIIAENSGLFMNDNGMLALEVGIGQASLVSELLERNGYCQIEIVNDLEGIERIVIARRVKNV